MSGGGDVRRIAANAFTGDNPAARRDDLKALLGEQTDTVKHHVALPYDELPAFMAKLRAHDGIGGLPLEFCILTATRTDETLAAPWEEIDWDKRLWNIPGRRRKGKQGDEQPLTVPLSDRCMEILTEMAERTGKIGLIFPGEDGSRLSENTLLDTIEQLGYKGIATTLGFRSSIRDWRGDCTNYPREILEAALGHKIGGTEGAYRRLSALRKRALLMRDWANFCAGVQHIDDNVVAINAAR